MAHGPGEIVSRLARGLRSITKKTGHSDVFPEVVGNCAAQISAAVTMLSRRRPVIISIRGNYTNNSFTLSSHTIAIKRSFALLTRRSI